MLAELDAYVERDNVPNTRRRVEALRELWSGTETECPHLSS